MATAKEQLLSMMNPQAARLLDQQLRQKQVAQRAQGAGMLSGLVQAYTGMGDVAQRATGIMPMGAMEMQARQQEKAQDEINTALKGVKTSEDYFRAADKLANSTSAVARAKANQLREEGLRLKRQEQQMDVQNRQLAMQEQQFAQNTILNSQKVTQNELAIQSASEALDKAKKQGELEAQQEITITNLLKNIDGLSDTKKELIGLLSPQDALKELTKIEDDRKNKALLSVATDHVNNVYFKGITPETAVNSTALNNKYLSAIAYYKKVGLDDQAKQLEDERKAIVEQKLTVEQREQDIREKWNTNKSVQTQKSKVTASNQGLSLLRQGGGLSELAAQVQFFKTIDPESVVKESEIEMANNASGLLQSINASIDKATGQGVLSDSLRKQLEQFFITAGSVAVEAYNSKLEKEKLAYQGRGLDAEFMFGDEVSLLRPIQDRPEDYTFNLDNLQQPINQKVLSTLAGMYDEQLGSDVKKALMQNYNQFKDNPEAIKQLQQQAKDMYGFDALGYMLRTQGQ